MEQSVLPDLLSDMIQVALHDMKCLRIIEPHPAAPGTHTTLVTRHALFQDSSESFTDAFLTDTHRLPFILHVSEIATSLTALQMCIEMRLQAIMEQLGLVLHYATSGVT